MGRKKVYDGEMVPSYIFVKKLGALEAIVKYLKEEKEMSYHKIAVILKRDDRTIWSTYNNVRERNVEIIEKSECVNLPLSIFVKERTVLESVVKYLKENGYSSKEIAQLIERDSRNISSICIKIKNIKV